MNRSDIKDAVTELKQAVREGIETLSDEQVSQILLLNELREELEKIGMLNMFGLDNEAREAKKALSFYDGLIGRKYWRSYILIYISMVLACRVVDTIEEACELYEKNKSMKK